MPHLPQHPGLVPALVGLFAFFLALLLAPSHAKDLILIETQTIAFLIDGVSNTERTEPSGVELTPEGDLLIANDNLPCEN